jgi:pimeloyl-ACP methyl ester carboxylesterase
VDAQDGPVILVGHSYGGVVDTEAGNNPKVAGLVYIAAFAPDKGESVSSLIKDPPPGAPVRPFSRRRMASCSSIGQSSRHRSRPTSTPRPREFMSESQVPWGSRRWQVQSRNRRGGRSPSWYLVAADDRMIPPPAQRAMAQRAGSTVTETGGSHAVYVSKPASRGRDHRHRRRTR